MCVLTFVPTASNGFILTNNRDENSSRPKALAPKKYHAGGSSIYYPKDAKAEGTWIATSQKYTLCLLNGAFEKHVPKESYFKSRGHVILDFFNHQNFELLCNNNFDGIENFTLIFIENEAKNIFQLVWNGLKLDVQNLKWNEAQIWSSCTLYNQAIRQKRAELFYQYLSNNPNPDYTQLIDFHRFTDIGSIENNLIMKRNDGTITQCISQIENLDNGIRFTYYDLLDSHKKSLIII